MPRTKKTAYQKASSAVNKALAILDAHRPIVAVELTPGISIAPGKRLVLDLPLLFDASSRNITPQRIEGVAATLWALMPGIIDGNAYPSDPCEEEETEPAPSMLSALDAGNNALAVLGVIENLPPFHGFEWHALYTCALHRAVERSTDERTTYYIHERLTPDGYTENCTTRHENLTPWLPVQGWYAIERIAEGIRHDYPDESYTGDGGAESASIEGEG